MASKEQALQNLSELPDTPAQGDIIYFTGSAWAKLAAGITPKVLTTKGAAANPAWEPAVPVGTILPWAKSITGIPTLPTGWMECDGSAVSDADSPINGENVPNLNATNKFLRGNTTSGGTGGSATHTHSPTSQDVGSGSGQLVGSIGNVSTESSDPAYMDVVYIIKYK